MDNFSLNSVSFVYNLKNLPAFHTDQMSVTTGYVIAIRVEIAQNLKAENSPP